MSRLEPVRALALADLMLWISDLLAPPRRDGEEPVVSRSSASDLDELLRHTRLSDQGWTSAQLLPIDALLGTPRLAEEKSRLFDGEVICPADECSYVRRDKGALLADIAGFQRAFGFRLAQSASERADHISAELALAALLLVMEVRARSPEAAAVTHDAWIEFASDHLGEWLPDFAMRLAATTRLPELVALADLLQCVWQTALVSMGAPPMVGAPRHDNAGPNEEDPLARDDSGTPYECGMVPDPPSTAR